MQQDSGRATELHVLILSHPGDFLRRATAEDIHTPPRIQILEVVPLVDCGRFPVKRIAGERVGSPRASFATGTTSSAPPSATGPPGRALAGGAAGPARQRPLVGLLPGRPARPW